MENNRINSNSIEIKQLEWDTKYFLLKSGKIILNNAITLHEREKLNFVFNNFEFITIVNIANNPVNNAWLGKETTSFLTDINTQFEKRVKLVENDNNEYISVFENYPYNEEVVKLAASTFVYSRFYNDPWLPNNKTKEIYKCWVENAFSQPGRFFIISSEKGNVSGFLLFSINIEELAATIELIAVDEAFRGLHVGQTIISKMESFVYGKGIRLIKVGTQIDNVGAIRFYSNCGFHYSGSNAIYHLWPNKR